MKKIIMILSLALVAQYSLAETAEKWEGSGVLFNIDGDAIGNYSLVVENTKLSPKKTQSDVTITLADGRISKHQCLITKGQKGWSSNCNNGQGGGYCFGEGLCQSYLEDGDKAYATTIIMDGPNDMRLLRTELNKGQAVHFFREKLKRE